MYELPIPWSVGRPGRNGWPTTSKCAECSSKRDNSARACEGTTLACPSPPANSRTASQLSNDMIVTNWTSVPYRVAFSQDLRSTVACDSSCPDARDDRRVQQMLILVGVVHARPTTPYPLDHGYSSPRRQIIVKAQRTACNGPHLRLDALGLSTRGARADASHRAARRELPAQRRRPSLHHRDASG